MKSLIFAIIATLIVLLIFVLFMVSNLLIEYIEVNEKIKDENWELVKNSRQLEQIITTCTKELKEYKLK